MFVWVSREPLSASKVLTPYQHWLTDCVPTEPEYATKVIYSNKSL